MYNSREIIKKEDGFLAYWFSAQVAYVIVRATEKLPLTPNHFTFASLVIGFVAAWYFSQGDSLSLIIGVILLNISFIFDCCDGQISRLKGLQSKMGHWFDYHSDKLKDGALLIGFAYGAYTSSGEEILWIFVIAFIAIFFQFLRNITALTRDNFKWEHEGNKDKMHSVVKKTDNEGQLVRTLRHSALFKLSDRVLLYTLFGLLNMAKEGIILYAALETFFSFSSAYLNYKIFYQYDKKE